MPLTQQQPVYSNPSGDGRTIKVTVGMHTLEFDLQRARDIEQGRIHELDFLLVQALLLLHNNGINLNNLGACATFLNANPIWWY